MRSKRFSILLCKISCAVTLLIIGGCSSFNDPVRYAPAEQDAEAKSFIPVPEKASIYIYREQGYMGEEKITVDIGSWAGGRTKGKTYLLAVVAAGEYVVTARGDEKEELQIAVRSGQTYFIKLRVRPAAVTANASLESVDEETGKAGVRKCRLVLLDDEPK